MRSRKSIIIFFVAIILMLLSVTAFADDTPAVGKDYDNSAYYNVEWDTMVVSEDTFGWTSDDREKWDGVLVTDIGGNTLPANAKAFYEMTIGSNKNGLIWYGWVGEDGYWHGHLYGKPTVRNSVTGQNVAVKRWETTVEQSGISNGFTMNYLGRWSTSGTGSFIDAESVPAGMEQVKAEVYEKENLAQYRAMSVRLYLEDGNSILLTYASASSGMEQPDAVTSNGGRSTASCNFKSYLINDDGTKTPVYEDNLRHGSVVYSLIYLNEPDKVKDYRFVIEKTVTGAADDASYTFPVRVSLSDGAEMKVNINTIGNGTFRKEVSFSAYEGEYTVTAREVLSDMPKGAQIVSGFDSGVAVLSDVAVSEASTLSLENKVDDPNPQHLEPGQTIGSVTVLNTTHGHTYEGYKIFDAEVNPGNVDAIIYTICEDSPWYEFVQDYFTLTELREDAEGKTVYKAEAKEGFNPKTFFENLPTDGITPDLEAISDHRDGIIKWENVPFGYYAITSTLGSWVTVNTNNPNVIVIDKNQEAVLDKNIIDGNNKVKINSASFGDSVNFDIDLLAGAFKANELVTYYRIKDTIDNGFDYDFTDGGNVTVKIVGTQQGTDGGNPYEYTLSPVSSLEALQTAKSGYYFIHTAGSRSFEIVIKWATLHNDGKLMPVYEDEFNNIHVTYSAILNDSAVIAGDGNLNTASFTYEKTSGFDPEYPPLEEPTIGTNPEDPEKTVTTTTYVYALGIEKVDASDKTVHLPGVKFTTTSFKAKKLSDGVYEVITAEDTMSTAAEYFEVPESGFIVIKGLGAGEYTFIESETLPGYNRLAEPLVITIPALGETVDTVAEIPCASVSVVENSTGIELPSTGSIGTRIFLICGTILVLIAGVLLVTNKRLAKGEE